MEGRKTYAFADLMLLRAFNDGTSTTFAFCFEASFGVLVLLSFFDVSFAIPEADSATSVLLGLSAVFPFLRTVGSSTSSSSLLLSMYPVLISLLKRMEHQHLRHYTKSGYILLSCPTRFYEYGISSFPFLSCIAKSANSPIHHLVGISNILGLSGSCSMKEPSKKEEALLLPPLPTPRGASASSIELPPLDSNR